MKLCCFAITVFFGTDANLEVTAGTSASQAQNPNQWYTLNPRENDPASIVAEILGNLKDALEKGGDGIDVTTSGRIILKSPAPAPVAVAPAKPDVVAKVGADIVVTTPKTTAPKTTAININTASEDELDTLPGVGPAIAKRIIAGRPYRSVDDLVQVDGIGTDKMTGIRPLVVVK